MDGDSTVLERCRTRRGEIQLRRRGEHYEIISNGVFLMATYNGDSERLLVTAGLARCPAAHRILIGGLGVGFSLGAALASPQITAVTVVEIEPRLIAWNRTYLAPFSGRGLDDPRTRIIQADLVRWLRTADGPYDLICLDIDNGPGWTVTAANRRLYARASLATLGRLLAPGGAVGFWSAHAAPDLIQRLRRRFARVEDLTVARERGEPDHILIAQGARPGSPPARP